ncbi:hypothetical protein FE783_30090 [Paenibacillus mesophilus]|uniref:hypothetical protein n=1 Tax=Paenibacillus mesophilus TaxID=2582849 RepID=UPI00110EB807|nr:hypothetical protein [Paenibacillus mesophilus]TMV45113.1 hypothetical protein FE783_30090 [Paenibacillus mesophilus]
MNIADVQQSIDFIQSVKLSMPDLAPLALQGLNAGGKPPIAQDNHGKNDSSANITAGSVISFVSGVSGQNRQDVLDSTLFAQFAANASANRETDAQTWYSTYLNTLGALAWTSQGFDFQLYGVSSSSFQLDDVVLDIVKAAFTADEYAVVRSSIDALKKLKDDDGRIKLFGHNAVGSNAGNFQIGAVTETNGALAMHTLGAYFSSSDTQTDFLFAHYKSSSTTIYKGVQSMTLNESLYANVRDAVQKRLGKNIEDFIANVPLSGN